MKGSGHTVRVADQKASFDIGRSLVWRTPAPVFVFSTRMS
jgi:hypothetical protein